MPDSPAETARWAIVVHGGAKDIPPHETAAYREGCEQAALAGSAVLSTGGAATEAVLAAIVVLENDSTFNAGNGAVTNSAGDVELDAALMDGRTLDVGAVAALKGARNPIVVAHALLRREETLLVADGARAFALAHAPNALTGLVGPSTSAGGDTVGCVAVDQLGDVAAGTSTGGIEGSPPGRVGDSPLPGCGLYAENGVGGGSISGTGERISRVTLAAWAMGLLRGGVAPDAARASIARLERVKGEGGIILIDGSGRIGWAHNSLDFAVAYASAGQPVRSFTRSEVNQPTE